MRRLRLVLNVILLLATIRMAAQEINEKDFTRYTTAQGLSDNAITHLTQDSTGYVWISTKLGLNRYNGNNFIQFHSTDENHSLPSEDLSGMAWLGNQRLAVLTSGLHIINTRTSESRNLFIPFENRTYQYKFNQMEVVRGDEKGHVFILTRSGFYHFDENYRLVYRFDLHSREELATSHFWFGRDLLEIDDHRYIIVSIAGLYLYDKRTRQFGKLKTGDCPLFDEFLNYEQSYYKFLQESPGVFLVLQEKTDRAIYVNSNTNKKTVYKWPFKQLGEEFHYQSKLLTVNDSVLYLTAQSSGFYKIKREAFGDLHFENKKYFPGYLCTALMLDKEKNLWVATSKGLFRQNPSLAQVDAVPLPAHIQEAFPNIVVDDIYPAGSKVYVATRGFGALLVYEKQTLEFIRRLSFEKYNNKFVNRVYSILQDSNRLLLATGGELLRLDTSTLRDTWHPGWKKGGARQDWLYELYRDRTGNIWATTTDLYRIDSRSGVALRIPTAQPVLKNIVRPILVREDTSGNLWIAGHGLCRYNIATGKPDRLIDSFPYIKMPDRQIAAMEIDRQNKIWFGSNNNGLISFSIENGEFRHFTSKDGLPDNNIAALLIIGDKLWIAGHTGIACMDLRSYRIVSFGREDGFPDLDIVDGTKFFYDSTAQQLYIGFSTAIVRFDPHKLLRKKQTPSVFIESVSTGNGKVNFLPGEGITSSWKENEISITIGSINFSNSQSQRFAYRILKDPSTPWQSLGNQPRFSISNLSPGHHRIQVKVFSLHNNWPEQVKEISIFISPPFWKKTWFTALMAVLLIIAGYLFLKWRTGVARKKEMVKTHIQELKADEYKNQFELEQISNYFSSSLADKKTEEEVLWDVTKNLIGRMNYVDCVIYMWNNDKTKLIQRAAYGPKGHPEIILGKHFDAMPGQGIVGFVAETLQPVILGDTRKDSRYRVDDSFRLSEICVPIIHNDELIGVMDSEHPELDYFKERDIKILTTIGTLIGNKLRQIESDQSLEVKQKELANINEQLAEAKLSALQAQMNPHFVFNALNSIKRMILDEDNEKASRYLTKFALMIRMTLEHSRDVFTTLYENIEYLTAYLEMEQLRFDDSFTYSIHTEEDIDPAETNIPSLMIQPLVENAIWHGLMRVKGEKKISIRFAQNENQIICTIEDNGLGIFESEKRREENKSPHVSRGLENLRNRIKIMNEKYDTGCSIEIRDLQQGNPGKRGTVVVLRFNNITTI